MLKRIGLLAFLILGLGGCNLFKSKDNAEPPTPLTKLTSQLTAKVLWKAHTGGSNDNYFKLLPVIHGGQLFTASPKGYVRAFNLQDGKLLWEKRLTVPISGGVGLGEGLLLLGTSKGEVIALAEPNGQEQWRSQVTSEILAIPRLSKGIVVVRTVDGKLFGLEKLTGKRIWVYERDKVPLLSLRGTSNPVVNEGRVVAGFDNGKIVVLDLLSGQLLWEASVSVPKGRTELERMTDIDADPILIDNTIYVSSYQGNTLAVDLQKGQPLWKRDISSHTGFTVDKDTLYLTDGQSQLWALNRYSGATLWKQDKLQARGITTPMIMGDYIVVGDKEGYLHWMRRDDGQFVARSDQFVARYILAKTNIQLLPRSINDNTLLILDDDGNLVALQLEISVKAAKPS
jgi:outer membrane protein assembly factor BamB